jgi:cytochrome c556
MQNCTWTVVGAGVLALTAFGLAAAGSGADDKDKDKEEKIIIPKDVIETVNKMADEAAKGMAPKKRAAQLAEDHPDGLKKIMWVFKPRGENGEGGLGIGKEPGKYNPDGIEVYIAFKSNPMRGKITAKELKDGAADFNRMADITIAVAEVTRRYAPKKQVGQAGTKQWAASVDDMQRAAEELKAAVKQEDPVGAKKAFAGLFASCNRCHSAFRDAAVEPKVIRDAVNRIADAVALGRKVDKDVADFVKENPDGLKMTMAVFKPRVGEGGGVGVGHTPGAHKPDAIEAVVAQQSDPRAKKMEPVELKSAAADFHRLADVTIAVAEITYQFAPKKKVGLVDAKDWNDSTDKLKRSAEELKAALKKEDPDGVRRAFTGIAASCSRCHALSFGMVVPKPVRDAVGTMADAVGKGQKVDKDAADFFKEHPAPLKQVMWVFRPREPEGLGGFGIGPRPGVYTPDGIGAYLAGKATPGAVTADELKGGAEDFNRLADVTIAVTEIVRRYPTPRNIPGPIAIPAHWPQYCDEVKRGAEGLKAAVKAQKPDDAQKAFLKMYTACTNCHTEFRLGDPSPERYVFRP